MTDNGKRKTITRVQYFKLCKYLEELGQDTINTRKMNTYTITEEVSRVLETKYTRSHIKNALADLGLTTPQKNEGSMKALTAINQFKEAFRTIEDLRERVANLEKQLGVKYPSTT